MIITHGASEKTVDTQNTQSLSHSLDYRDIAREINIEFHPLCNVYIEEYSKLVNKTQLCNDERYCRKQTPCVLASPVWAANAAVEKCCGRLSVAPFTDQLRKRVESREWSRAACLLHRTAQLEQASKMLSRHILTTPAHRLHSVCVRMCVWEQAV